MKTNWQPSLVQSSWKHLIFFINIRNKEDDGDWCFCNATILSWFVFLQDPIPFLKTENTAEINNRPNSFKGSVLFWKLKEFFRQVTLEERRRQSFAPQSTELFPTANHQQLHGSLIQRLLNKQANSNLSSQYSKQASNNLLQKKS